MAVLAEAISVIVRKSAIDDRVDGGEAAFLAVVPNASLCGDDELYRVGFMRPDDVERFIGTLTLMGLEFEKNGRCMDMAVVDQMRGSTLPCDWLQFARIPFDEEDNKVSICWYFGGEKLGAGLHLTNRSMGLSVPRGWEYEGSISQKVGFVPNSDVEERLTFLREEDGMLVYEDKETGKEVFVSRAK